MQEIRIQRDVFGRLLYASLENDIDLEKALSYPNAPISFSLCHADGNICKTKKSVITTELLKYQEADVTVENSNIHIIDGFYLLHTLKNVPGKYGKISEYILKMITFNRKEVHIIFDKFKEPSMKDYEHDKRGDEETHYDINRNTKRPADFSKLLRSKNFKKKFVEFLIKDWSKQEYLTIIMGKIVKLNYDQCYTYTVSSASEINSVY